MENSKSNVVGSSIFVVILMSFFFLAWLNSCTVTLQNTIASGSTDVADSQQSADPTVSPNVTIPVVP